MYTKRVPEDDFIPLAIEMCSCLHPRFDSFLTSCVHACMISFLCPTSYWFCKKFLHWWDKFVIGKINSKSCECIPNLCTYPTFSLTLKTGKCISTKWQKEKYICLVKCILNCNEELGRFIKDWNRHPLWHPFATRSPYRCSPRLRRWSSARAKFSSQECVSSPGSRKLHDPSE
jgi:hypothetical protein